VLLHKLTADPLSKLTGPASIRGEQGSAISRIGPFRPSADRPSRLTPQQTAGKKRWAATDAPRSDTGSQPLALQIHLASLQGRDGTVRGSQKSSVEMSRASQ
jgi:hypothetical protein